MSDSARDIEPLDENWVSHLCRRCVTLTPGTDRYVHMGCVSAGHVIRGFTSPSIYNIGFIVGETEGFYDKGHFPMFESGFINTDTLVGMAAVDGVVTMNYAKFSFNLVSKLEHAEGELPLDPVYLATVCLRKYTKGSSSQPLCMYYMKSAVITYDSGNVNICFDEPFSVDLHFGQSLVASIALAGCNSVATETKDYDDITFSFDICSNFSYG